MSSSPPKTRVPSPAEFRLLELLWRLREATIDDLLLTSEEEPSPNYKTIQSILRVMEQKQLVSHHVRGRAFVFEPRVEPQQIRRLSVRSFIGRYFGGSPTQLMQSLLQDEDIGVTELGELEQLIRRRRRAKSSNKGLAR
jgi:BlaI family penicillinase repressor